MRLTYREPPDNFTATLNLFYCKDMDTWVRGGGEPPEYPDVRLDDWIRKIIKTFNADIDADSMNSEELNAVMAEMVMFEDTETVEDLIALLYNAAWAFSELNGRLMKYEDTGLTPQEVVEMKARLEGLEK